ncbi:MAG: aspartate:alanine exchanger family transporter [Candidatus Eisenbacteria bacterium]|nr:aspartate:alanine exchanger family transporter [Candidatus Eisenbacteria bacterium]
MGLYELFSTSAPALLFTVVGLGYFLGNIKIGGFSLGIAAVLFVGLIFGAIDPVAFVVPEVIYVLGLILFVYTVGLTSGPIFFNLFRRQWLGLTAIALVATAGAAIVDLVVARLFGIGAPVASGIFCGSLTNTPALAAAVETLRAKLTGTVVDPEQFRMLTDGPTVGYSIAYPFGVLGLILAMQISTRISRVDFRQEHERSMKVSGIDLADLKTREIRVTNPQLIGKSFGSAMLTDLTGMVFTRRMRDDGEVDLVVPDMRLEEGDVLVGVGTAEAVGKAELLIGPLVQESVEQMSPNIEYRDLVVINRQAAGKAIQDLAKTVGHPVIVSRIRRGGVHITPHPGTTLELGDQIRIVGHHEDLERATAIVGNPLKDISEADFLSFSLGLVLGVLVGMLPIPFFGGRILHLGFAGGPLVMGLILGRAGRTGPIVWTMPANASLTLRQLGILFFLAGVGTRAGGSFVHTMTTQGAELLVMGAAVTVASIVLVILFCKRVLHYDMISTYGILSGVHTQPAALAFASSHTGSENANISYAAVYPVALIAKIILAQILVAL